MKIHLRDIAMDLDFHPSINIVAACLINGQLLMYRYDAEATRLLEVGAHAESCRALRFINEGRAIVTGSLDCSILATDVETGAQIARLENSHGSGVSRIVNLTESTIASGDDEGCIKVWDTRQRTCCNTFNINNEYVSDMTFASDSMKLVGTSFGGGTLSVCNLRSNKIQTQSEFSTDELLSVVIMKNGRKVVCGTQNGTLLLYSWGFFEDCSDRFVDLSPNPVNALLKLDEDRIITGTENGLISLVGILPNRFIQPIAQHSKYGYPVERLAFSHDKNFIGSISHDQILKLWDLDESLQESENTMPNHFAASGSDSESMDVDISIPKPSKGRRGKMEAKNAVLAIKGLTTNTAYIRVDIPRFRTRHPPVPSAIHLCPLYHNLHLVVMPESSVRGYSSCDWAMPTSCDGARLSHTSTGTLVKGMQHHHSVATLVKGMPDSATLRGEFVFRFRKKVSWNLNDSLVIYLDKYPQNGKTFIQQSPC
ncbi:WD domain repeat-containing protein 55 [Orobanche hederae]